MSQIIIKVGVAMESVMCLPEQILGPREHVVHVPKAIGAFSV